VSEISAVRRYYWSLRRELWEHPSIYVVPLAAGALVLIGFLISAIRIVPQMHSPALGAAQEMVGHPYDFAEGLIMFSTLAVAIFYCLDALYGERRDRSILFWKSLPVSDAMTVIAKASIPLLVIPLVTFAVTFATLVVMTGLGSAASALAGLDKVALGTRAPLLRTSLLLLYHLLTVHALWWAPFFGWLLLISAWARRAPFVWAAVPLIGITLAERIAFNTSHVAHLLKSRLDLSPEAVVAQGTMPTDPMTHLTPGLFFSSPALWIGLAIAATCLAVAVRLRRDRGPT
jgi:ABC-2 type transport system permease protein